jgi:6-pyruvoyltetrahydropterin/6-carboxytetrahydropterin synthase
LIVALKGEINPETGFVMDMKVLKKIIEIEIKDRFDHKNLNEEVAAFNIL